jgi:hypothetical protein
LTHFAAREKIIPEEGTMTHRIGLALLVSASVGCVKTLQVSTTQPNPVMDSAETLQEGRHLHIDVRDIDLPKSFHLRQSASFVMRSHDRLTFHVDLVHKWEEIADPKNWTVKLEDDHGHIYLPESEDDRSNDHVSQVWDMDKWMAIKNRYGDVVGAKNNPDCECQELSTLSSVDVYRGKGDFEFYSKDLMNRDVHWLRFTMRHDDLIYEFTWNFGDQADPDHAHGGHQRGGYMPDNEIVDPTFIMPANQGTPTADVVN